MSEIPDSCQRAFAQLLKTCAIDIPTKKGMPVKKSRIKGKMSGYNCFTKTIYAAEKEKAKDEKRKPMSYSDLLRMKTWSTLEEKTKTHWNGLAEQGCPDIKLK